jgi:ABC-type glutathione transport system ATPase component
VANPALNLAAGEPLLLVEHLRKQFPARSGWARSTRGHAHAAVDDVSFAVSRGQTLGLIGESGSGKSTTARCILRLMEPTSGAIWFKGVDITASSKGELRRVRREMQIVFQSPYGSLDPRRSVGASIAEPLSAHRVGTRSGRRARVRQLLEYVGLNPAVAKYHPQEFSGGERQRIGIARALALEPELIVCDEPVSALDVSVQAQILNLLRDLQDEFGLTYVFISHDIGVVRTMSDEIVVMKDGKIAEAGPAEQICTRPQHPYTQSLIAAASGSHEAEETQ